MAHKIVIDLCEDSDAESIEEMQIGEKSDDVRKIMIHVNDKIACYSWKNKTAEEYKTLYDNYSGFSTGSAILTGKISNIFAIDVDNMETYNEILVENNITDIRDITYCENTPNGFHAYFIMPKQLSEFSSKTNKPYDGWDYRNNGGYCIAENSKYTARCCTNGGKRAHKCGAENDENCKNKNFIYHKINNLPISEMPEVLIRAFLESEERIINVNDIFPQTVPERDEFLKYLDIMDCNKILSNRDNWVKFMFICKQNNLSVDDFHNYSSRSDNHGPCECYKKWDEPYTKREILTIGTVKMWARETNPDAYFRSLETVNKFENSNPYTYYLLRQHFMNRDFESYEAMDNAIFEKCKCSIVYTVVPQFFIIKSHDEIVYNKNLGNSSFNMTYTKNEKKKKISISDYVKNKPELSFANIDCVIDHNKIRSDMFNVFPGYQATETDEHDSGVINAINKFIFEVWANSDDELFNYIISWFANILQHDSINGVALVCYSTQGCGKNTLIDFFRFIFGDKLISESTGITAITQKHNTVIENKRLNVINETSSTRDEFRSNFDRLKNIITDAKISIEPKGLSPYKISNIGNYILFTNHKDSIIVEQSDRRYQVLELSDKYRNNTDFFAEFRNLYFNQRCADIYYTYLMRFEVSDVRKIISTNLRDQMMEYSKPSPLRFLEDYKNDVGADEDVQASVFYRLYSEWCATNGEKQMTNNKFAPIIKEVLKVEKRRAGNYYVF